MLLFSDTLGVNMRYSDIGKRCDSSIPKAPCLHVQSCLRAFHRASRVASLTIERFGYLINIKSLRSIEPILFTLFFHSRGFTMSRRDCSRMLDHIRVTPSSWTTDTHGLDLIRIDPVPDRINLYYFNLLCCEIESTRL